MFHVLSGETSSFFIPFYHGFARMTVATSMSGEEKSFIISKSQTLPVYQSVNNAIKLLIGIAKYIMKMNQNMLQLLAHQFPVFTIDGFLNLIIKN